jgi:23S rRNA (cytosine1962-C5)-methyltransferase
VLWGEEPGEFEVRQHGVRFRVAPLGGQKTGAFLDQRLNHHRAGELARGRALDCFTFNGGFALNLARNCTHVTAIDISSEALRAADENRRLNGLENVEFREANVFDALREMETAGERFDTIVLDPPAFAKNRGSRTGAERGYKEINLRAMKLMEREGGLLITCTCSYHISEETFLGIIHDAARDAHRRVQIVERRTQAPDHPVLAGMPETFYLKCIIARIV